MVLAPQPDAVLLIRRAEREGDPWSGHMAFPGGRHSPVDRDLLATAIRETAEEVGLRLDERQLLGVLDDVAPRSPGRGPLVVRPFLFALDHRPELRLNHEVALALWAPIDELRAERTYRPATFHHRGAPRVYPAYHLADHVVWGMTERILTPLLNDLSS
ncbi:MAG TPA: CoA pyrophosphatase [Gemmatimonadales bacterium]|nr:CoA pyrophosphatase [Gemmatimonadales bacterium]